MIKLKPIIWCDHCNAEISASGIKSCVRKTCQAKQALKELENKHV